MSTTVKFELRQHGVGHGGFHTQRVILVDQTLRFTGQSVNMIYDCGSKDGIHKGLKQSINLFVEILKLDSADIDLLVLSHFDWDHINGLGELSAACRAKGVKVKEIWIPLLNDLERKFVQLEHLKNERGNDLWYLRLLENPEVILNEDFPDARIVPIESNDTKPTSEYRDRLNEDNYTFVEAERPRLTSKTTTSPLKNSVGVIDSNTGREIPIWEFLPYRSSYAVPKIKEQNERQSHGIDIEKISLEELMLWRKNNKDRFDAVAKAVKDAFKGIRGTGSNLMSLCLYSGPIVRPEFNNLFSGLHRTTTYHHMSAMHYCLYPICLYREHPFTGSDSSRNGCYNRLEYQCAEPFWSTPGWLGTGDYCLKPRAQINDLVSTLGKDRMDNISIVSAPHHGSKHDSSQYFWQVFKNLTVVTFEAKYARGMSRAKHPHKEVIDEIRTYINKAPLGGCTLVFCTEGCDFILTSKFEVESR